MFRDSFGCNHLFLICKNRICVSVSSRSHKVYFVVLSKINMRDEKSNDEGNKILLYPSNFLLSRVTARYSSEISDAYCILHTDDEFLTHSIRLIFRKTVFRDFQFLGQMLPIDALKMVRMRVLRDVIELWRILEALIVTMNVS